MPIRQARADAGDLAEALAGLERHSRTEFAAERYPTAREGFAAILELDPSQEAAQRIVSEIDSGTTARRREERRRLIVRTVAIGTLLFVTLAGTLEIAARSAWARADREILESGMLTDGRVDDAITLLSKVCDGHPLSSASWFDILDRIRVLEQQLERE